MIAEAICRARPELIDVTSRSGDQVDVITLTVWRTQRHLLALRQTEMAEVLAAGLQHAAKSLIHLARGIDNPVLRGDKEFEQKFFVTAFSLFEFVLLQSIKELELSLDVRQEKSIKSIEAAFSYFIFSSAQLGSRTFSVRTRTT